MSRPLARAQVAQVIYRAILARGFGGLHQANALGNGLQNAAKYVTEVRRSSLHQRPYANIGEMRQTPIGDREKPETQLHLAR
jgi:hypothetical protein